MKHEDFLDLMHHRFQVCEDLLAVKSVEYSRGNDKLYNFKVAAAFDIDRAETPERALYGMLKKHLVSAKTIIDDLDAGIVVSPQKASEKITDIINYFLCLEALLSERWTANFDRKHDINVKGVYL